MGQPIVVKEKVTAQPGVVRYEANRSLTGMGHERYAASREVTGERPPDELARRLFERGGVTAIHIYSNMITVELAPGAESDGIKEIVEGLYTYYRPGVLPAIP
jgi:hypothetical protein